MDNEIENIRLALETWDEAQKRQVAEALKDIGETITLSDFSAMPEDEITNWCFPSTPLKIEADVMAKFSVRMACYYTDAVLNSLNEGRLARAIKEMSMVNVCLTSFTASRHGVISATERSAFSLLGAMAKIANDPRQAEKTFIFECWQSWQKSPDIYEGKAAFARDMLTKCEELKSTKKIEDWCREWEKAHPAG